MKSGHEGDKQEWERHTEAQACKDRQRSWHRQNQCRAQRDAHKGATTRSRDQRSKRTGAKRAEAAFLRHPIAGQRGATHFEQTSQIERDCQRQEHQQQNHPGILKLERPANVMAHRAGAYQYCAQSRGRRYAPGKIGKPFHFRGVPVSARSSEAQRLERQDREHARHQVEQQPAKDRTGKCNSERARIGWRGTLRALRRSGLVDSVGENGGCGWRRPCYRRLGLGDFTGTRSHQRETALTIRKHAAKI